jgi:hypothetical protein
MKRPIAILFSYAFLAGCPGSSGSKDGGIVNAALSGALYDALQGQARSVVVYDFRDGKMGDQLCTTMSAGQGAWSCDLGALSGDFMVEVEQDRSSGLRAIVDGVVLGESRANVQVTPVTTLVAAYAQHLVASGLNMQAALTKARSLIFGHFGGFDHGRVQPAHLDQTLRSMSDEATCAVLLVAFQELARKEAETSGLSYDGLVNQWSLVGALVADISADGVFDGRGADGQLRLGTIDLGGDTLRPEYARAVLSWLGSAANTTSLSASDFEPLARSIAADMSEIFPQGTPGPLDDQGPMISRFVLRAGTRELGPSDPASGDVLAELSATAADGVARMDLSIQDQAGGAIDVVDQHTGYRLWRIHGERLSDGVHALQAEVRDMGGIVATATRALITDNTPPVLTATAAGVVDAASVRVSGTVQDAIGPVTRIDLAGGGATATIANPPASYAGSISIACNATWPITVRAFDAAGNVATATVTVRCDSTPPSIGWDASMFQQESTLDAIYAADGTSVGYTWSLTGADVVRLDGTSSATITKYFNRLDQAADNLPIYRFWANDTEGGVRVEYRYIFNGQEERSWTLVSPKTVTPSRSEYELPVSYQTLGVTLASGALTDTHRVELRATDEAGNTQTIAAQFQVRLRSPPVWFGGCRLNPSISTYALQGNTLDAIYRQPSVGVFEGRFRYALSLPPSSLAPSAGVYVAVAPGMAHSQITQLNEDRHDGQTFYGVNDFNLYCYPNPTVGTTKIGPDSQHLGPCADPETTIDHVALTVAPNAAINDVEVHVTTVSAADPRGIPLALLGTGEFLADPDQENSVRVALDHPEIHIGGVTYDWSTSFTVPNNYTLRTFPPRYRVPQWNRVGYNYEQPLAMWQAYPFVTRAYISIFEIDLSQTALSARHQTLASVPVGVQVMPECSQPLVYRTSL